MLDQHLRHRLAAQIRAAHLDVNHLLKYVRVELDQGYAVRAVAIGSVVDEDVDASELLKGALDHGIDIGFVGHVANQGESAAAQCAHLVGGALDVAPADFLLVGRERGRVAARAG